MDIVSFIPARGGSKSIPHKNIKKLGGKPLINWSIEVSQKCDLRTIVDTDNKEIAEIAENLGAEVMIRPSELAQDKTSMFEMLKNEVLKIDPISEYIILLQPTSPFRSKKHIELAIEYMKNNPQYDCLISVEKVPEKWNPAQVIIETSMGKKMASGVPISKRITRRQDFPNAYIPTGSIYLFKTSNLEKGSIYGNEIMLLETEGSVNINSESDFLQAEEQLNKK